MNIREFAKMLLKLPDQEAIVQVVDGDEYINFSDDPYYYHVQYFNYKEMTGTEATPSRYQPNYLKLGYL